MQITVFQRNLSKRFLQLYKLAIEVATWSEDPEYKEGCVIIDSEKKFVTCNPNEFVSNAVTIENAITRQTRDILTIPSAVMAIVTAKQKLTGGYLFTNIFPNPTSAALIIESEIKEICTPMPKLDYSSRWNYKSEDVIKMFENANVSITFVID